MSASDEAPGADASSDAGAGAEAASEDPRVLRPIIVASSLGTLFEWYDFYLYGSLAVFFGGLFFPKGNETAQLLASLATFGAGFGVRPLGAVVFGYIGDRVGRKYTFLVTMATMGLSTAFIGLLPTYDRIGIWATVLLVALRLLQGLALGGEYGGAATYVAEHVPDRKRGYYTSYIQTTATLGLFLSLLVILACRVALGAEAFEAWGWRIPFLVSLLLLGISVWIRLALDESPVFKQMKAEGTRSKAPLRESFAEWGNLKIVILALFGLTAGQAVVWYTGQFYTLFFLTQTLKVEAQTANILVAISLLLTGLLTDALGRKTMMLVSLAGSAVFTLAAAMAPDWHPLLLFRGRAGLRLGWRMRCGRQRSSTVMGLLRGMAGHLPLIESAAPSGRPRGPVIPVGSGPAPISPGPLPADCRGRDPQRRADPVRPTGRRQLPANRRRVVEDPQHRQ